MDSKRKTYMLFKSDIFLVYCRNYIEEREL